MGSGSSCLGAPPSRTKRRLSSLFCGFFPSPSQREHHVAGSVVNSPVYQGGDADNKSHCPAAESACTSLGDAFLTSSKTETGTSSESSISLAAIENDGSNDRLSSERACLSERFESFCPHEISAETRHYQQRHGDTQSVPHAGQILQVDGNSDTGLVDLDNNAVNNDIFPLDRTSIEENSAEVSGMLGSNPVPSRPISGSRTGSQSHGDDNTRETISSGLGLLLSDRVLGQTEGSVLFVDLVSISSMPSSTREERRNSRRAFWHSLSSHSSRRDTDFPAILFTTEDGDNIGRSRRWLLDSGSDIFDDWAGDDSWPLGRRNHTINGHRRRPRSEFLGRLRAGSGEGNQRTTCPLGLHPDGSCLCLLGDEPGTLRSIQRIVALAESLFQLWEIIHGQSESFSLSMLSNPAPESVVDSLPLKCYEKRSGVENGDDIEQCYICLSEYEDGDKIRVLPCNHEYHMLCVDKWLKDIHGVCPLCRGDVSGGVREGSNSHVDLT